MPGYKPESKLGSLWGRYKVWAPTGEYRGIHKLNNDAKKRFEAKGFRFERTNLNTYLDK